MTLTTHGITGAAVAATMPQHMVLGFCLGFASHFLLDAIPHGDYPISTDSLNPDKGGDLHAAKSLLLDAARIGTDGVLGLLVPLALFGAHTSLAVLLAGAAGGMLPDALQFVYLRFPHQPIRALQNFHHAIHTKIRLEGRPLLAVFTQAAFVVLVVGCFKGFFHI